MRKILWALFVLLASQELARGEAVGTSVSAPAARAAATVTPVKLADIGDLEQRGFKEPKEQTSVRAQDADSNARKLPFVTIDYGPRSQSVAWYFVATYHPKGKAVFGIPISRLDPAWCEAELLEPGKFPPAVVKELESVFVDEEEPKIFHHSRMGFSTPQFASGPYGHLVASSGVYEECSSGETGIFLIVVDRANEARPKLVFNKSYPDERIAVLRVFPDGMLMVNWCYSCGDGTAFGWRKGKFQALPSGNDPNDLDAGYSACVNRATDLYSKADSKSSVNFRTKETTELTITKVVEGADEKTPRWYRVKLNNKRGNEGFLQSSNIKIKDPNFGCE